MLAGRLDRRISILRATPAADEFNEQVETWGTLAVVWAHATPVMDAERQRAGETLASKSYRFTIRYSSQVADVDPRDRVTFDGRTYDVQGVKEIGRREGLEITATARAEAP
jgi:SPP1 family predicted phage head-tail adaptor